LFFKKTLKVSI